MIDDTGGAVAPLSDVIDVGRGADNMHPKVRLDVETAALSLAVTLSPAAARELAVEIEQAASDAETLADERGRERGE